MIHLTGQLQTVILWPEQICLGLEIEDSEKATEVEEKDIDDILRWVLRVWDPSTKASQTWNGRRLQSEFVIPGAGETALTASPGTRLLIGRSGIFFDILHVDCVRQQVSIVATLPFGFAMFLSCEGGTCRQLREDNVVGFPLISPLYFGPGAHKKPRLQWDVGCDSHNSLCPIP